jgi:hypothetical protein
MYHCRSEAINNYNATLKRIPTSITSPRSTSDNCVMNDDVCTAERNSYMRRHPCILDTSASLLERQPWIYQLAIMTATAIGISFLECH